MVKATITLSFKKAINLWLRSKKSIPHLLVLLQTPLQQMQYVDNAEYIELLYDAIEQITNSTPKSSRKTLLQNNQTIIRRFIGAQLFTQTLFKSIDKKKVLTTKPNLKESLFYLSAIFAITTSADTTESIRQEYTDRFEKECELLQEIMLERVSRPIYQEIIQHLVSDPTYPAEMKNMFTKKLPETTSKTAKTVKKTAVKTQPTPVSTQPAPTPAPTAVKTPLPSTPPAPLSPFQRMQQASKMASAEAASVPPAALQVPFRTTSAKVPELNTPSLHLRAAPEEPTKPTDVSQILTKAFFVETHIVQLQSMIELFVKQSVTANQWEDFCKNLKDNTRVGEMLLEPHTKAMAEKLAAFDNKKTEILVGIAKELAASVDAINAKFEEFTKLLDNK